MPLIIPMTGMARQPSYYQHLTDLETNYRLGWSWGWWVFYSPDTMDGPVRSNNSILIKYTPTFLDHVTSSASEFAIVSGGPGPNLIYDPYFNAPIFPIPEDLPQLRERATESYSSHNYAQMTTIVFRDADGAEVYQRRLGIIDEDSLIATLRQDEPHIVWVDGPVDVKGIVNGRYTIFAEGPIGLIDDVIYPGANIRNADFDEQRTTSMIGLVTLDSIIVKNTNANGRNYNEDEDGNNYAKHSIMINGVLIALGGSFTFAEKNRRSDYNHDWPWDRGTIYTRGSVVQRTRGALKVDRIGYWWHKKYDNRLRTDGPPGLGPSDYPIIQQDNDRLDLKPLPFEVFSTQAKSLFMREGGRLVLMSDATLDVRDSLVLHGTSEAPLEISVAEGSATISLANREGYVSLENVHIGEEVTLEIMAREFNISECDIRDQISVDGELNIASSRMGGFVRVTSASRAQFDHVVFNDGLMISSYSDEIAISNCTFASSNAVGVRLRGNCDVSISNSIVAFNGQGVVVEGSAEAVITYSDVFGNIREDLVGVALGDGSFQADPGFIDRVNGNLSLTEASPCIDAGDPASPRDPDGTRADIGAFWLDRGMGVKDNPPYPPFNRRGGLPLAGLTASPNPFNATTVIRFEGDRFGNLSYLRIYDLGGREVFREVGHPPIVPPPSGGERTVVWDATAFPAGIYVVRVGSGKDVSAMKIVKVD